MPVAAPWRWSCSKKISRSTLSGWSVDARAFGACWRDLWSHVERAWTLVGLTGCWSLGAWHQLNVVLGWGSGRGWRRHRAAQCSSRRWPPRATPASQCDGPALEFPRSAHGSVLCTTTQKLSQPKGNAKSTTEPSALTWRVNGGCWAKPGAGPRRSGQESPDRASSALSLVMYCVGPRGVCGSRHWRAKIGSTKSSGLLARPKSKAYRSVSYCPLAVQQARSSGTRAPQISFYSRTWFPADSFLCSAYKCTYTSRRTWFPA